MQFMVYGDLGYLCQDLILFLLYLYQILTQ